MVENKILLLIDISEPHMVPIDNKSSSTNNAHYFYFFPKLKISGQRRENWSIKLYERVHQLGQHYMEFPTNFFPYKLHETKVLSLQYIKIKSTKIKKMVIIGLNFTEH